MTAHHTVTVEPGTWQAPPGASASPVPWLRLACTACDWTAAFTDAGDVRLADVAAWHDTNPATVDPNLTITPDLSEPREWWILDPAVHIACLAAACTFVRDVPGTRTVDELAAIADHDH